MSHRTPRRPVLRVPTFDALEARVVPAAVVRASSGATPAALQAVVDAYRSDLGGGAANPNAAGSFLSGRREVNWDGVGDALASPANLPTDFFNTTSPRGIVYSAPSVASTFRVSQDDDDPTDTDPDRVGFADLNPAYAFPAFSNERLFAPVGGNVTDVRFFVPGTTIPAATNGFGVVFVDVDNAAATTVEFFRPDDTTLGTFTAVALDDGFSFLGVTFNAGERVGRVRITTGNVNLGADDGDGSLSLSDVVVMDDFFYGEPRLLPDLIAADATGPNLLRFSAANPSRTPQTIPLAGFDVGEVLAGLDYRPATGDLYALGVNGVTGRLLRVDFATSRLVQVGIPFIVSGSDFGIDFNPTNDRLRVVSDSGINLSIHPDTGVPTAQTPLNPGTPTITAAAYSNSLPGAANTTLFTIDSATDRLFRQDPPASGTQTLVGPLGVNTSALSGFDIEGGTNSAYAVLEVDGAATLYQIDTTTGTVTLLGSVGSNVRVRAAAVVPPPRFNVATPAAPVDEGNSGTTRVTATVTLTGDTAGIGPITVRPVTTDGTAVAGSDYTPLPTATLTFAAVGAQTIATDILGDEGFEPNETFSFGLTRATGALIVTASAPVTIANEDPLPRLDIADATVTEGNAGEIVVPVTLSLSAPSTEPVTALVTVIGETATSGIDYRRFTPTTVTIPAGTATFVVNLTVVGDTNLEGTETFRVELSDVTMAIVGRSEATVTIRDDDAPPRPPGTPTECYVQQLYRELLGRAADADGLAFFASALDAGRTTRASVAEQFQATEEYRTRQLDSLYQQTLGRSLDDSGKATWLAFLAAGGTTEEVQIQLIGSEEYFGLANRSDGRFIDRIYREVLRRRADLNGRAFWVARLAAGAERVDVARQILQSREEGRVEVGDLFNEVLRRKPETTALNAFGTVLDRGTTGEVVRAVLLGSDEYFARFCR